MKTQMRKTVALGLLGMMIVSCAKNQEMTDQQKMHDFNFAVFEEKTVDVVVQNDLGEFVQAPILLTDGPKILGYGVTDMNGEIHMPISWHAGMDLEVHVGNNNKVDVGDLNHPVALTYNAPKTSTNKTETIIDTDGDGVTDSLDIDPNDARFVSYSSASGRFMFEDIYPWKGDYDFNDVVVDYQVDGYLDANGDVRKVTILLLPKNDGAAKLNSVRLTLDQIMSSDINSLDSASSFDEKPSLISSGSTPTWKIFTDITGKTGFWRPAGYTRWVTYTSYYTDRYGASVSYNSDGNLINSFSPITIVTRQESQFIWYGYHIFERNSFDNENPKTSSISFELPAGYQMDDITGNNFGLHIQSEESGVVRTKDQNNYYQDEFGMPYGLHLPQEVMWPEENDDITEKYTDFTAWATSNGTTNQNWWE